MDFLLGSRRWFQGPEFLWKPTNVWPQSTGDFTNLTALDHEDPEVKKASILTYATSMEELVKGRDKSKERDSEEEDSDSRAWCNIVVTFLAKLSYW